METTKNALSEETKQFFFKVSEYLDTKLYFYGSVQRIDYIPEKSDIDVEIFTDNEYSTMRKLEHLLKINHKDVHKIAWIINKTPVYGYKVKYTNPEKNINVEFCIYNTIYKKIVSEEHKSKFILPLHISIALYILKYVFYKLNIISSKNFNELKRMLLNPTPVHFSVIKT